VQPSPPDPDETRADQFRAPPPTTGGRAGHLIMGLTAFVLVFTWLCAFAAPWSPPMPAAVILLLTALPWVALGLLIWCFVLWTALPDHPLGAVLTAVATLAPLLHWGPSWPDHGVEPGLHDLTVMTWNVRRFWGGEDKARTPYACVALVLATWKPQVVVLQEVTIDDLATLSSTTDLSCAHATYSASDDADSAGLAICTRGDAWEITMDKARPYTASEDWQYLFTELGSGDRRVNVMAVHLHPYRVLHDPMNAVANASTRVPIAAQAQQEQTRALLDRVAALSDPTLVAGDFNSTRDTPLHARIRRYLVDTWEQGATGFVGTVTLLERLPLRIDYIYATPDLLTVDSQVPTVDCSDHRPVISTVRLAPP
jgi:endonuclease/exonuclease/phosphatase (EEP) superfamily protein YafD